jgi:hypothetical protein
MGKKSPSAPAAPDPVATAQAQGTMNRETAITQFGLNAVNQRDPYGSLYYDQIGTWADGTPRFQATQTLAPEEQHALNQTRQAQDIYGQASLAQLGNTRNVLSQQFNPNLPSFTGSVASRSNDLTTSLPRRSGDLTTSLPSRSGQLSYDFDVASLGGGTGSRDAVQSALMNRMNPSLNMAREGAENRLRNQGLMPGSEAWNNAMRDVAQSETDARMSAIINAGQEQSRIFDVARQNAGFRNQSLSQAQDMDANAGAFRNQSLSQAQDMDANAGLFRNQSLNQAQNMDLAQGNFGNAARQQSFQEQLALRTQPLNETAALLSGQQVQSPSFVTTPQTNVAPTDYMQAVGLQQAAQNNAFNARNQNYGTQLSGMYGLGSAALGGWARSGFAR